MRMIGRLGILVVVSLAAACEPPGLDEDLSSDQGAGSPAPDAAVDTVTDAGTRGGSTGSGMDAGTPPVKSCSPLPPPAGNVVTVAPAQASSLASIVSQAKTGDTIMLKDGTYALAGAELAFKTPGVTLRSESGNREAVILDGQYQSREVVRIVASDVTIASVTIARANHHAIHAYPGGATIESALIYDVHVIDPGQQAIKINPESTQTKFVDKGTVACSHIEMTDAGRPHVSGCYTGGIDAHHARGWHVRDNLIEGFWCRTGLSEHAVHFWTGSRDTIVERNVLRDNARGIGFGLNSISGRTYADNPCPGVSNVGHYSGIARNNFISATRPELFSSRSGFDTGIGLENACGATVVNNTVFSSSAPASSSIEWRFGGTTATVKNNLTSHRLLPREGATATLATNVTSAAASWFADVNAGNLHLTASAAAAFGAGTSLGSGVCDDDVDGDVRGASIDVGADQHE